MPHESEIRLDERPARDERAPRPPERVLADGVEHDVVGLAALREVLLQIVDDLVCSQRPHELDVLRVAHGGDVGAEVPGELHGRGPDGSGWRRTRGPVSLRERPPCEGTRVRAPPRRSRARRRRTSCLPGCARARRSHGRRRTRRAHPLGRRRRGRRRRSSRTAVPTSTTSPANSMPEIRCFGRRNPVTKRLMKNSALRSPVSVRVTVVANTLTRTSSSFGTGRSTSSTRRTSGGPYLSWTTARIVVLVVTTFTVSDSYGRGDHNVWRARER